jgi:hypothetical protein
MSTEALRYNQGKPKLSMVDPILAEATARVLEFGAKKYSRDNWRNGMAYTNVLDSMERHLAALKRGEDIDPESGESHEGHIACNCMFLLYYKATKTGTDDRYQTPSNPTTL